MSSSDDDESVTEPPVPHGLGELPCEAADILARDTTKALESSATFSQTTVFDREDSELLCEPTKVVH